MEDNEDQLNVKIAKRESITPFIEVWKVLHAKGSECDRLNLNTGPYDSVTSLQGVEYELYMELCRVFLEVLD